MNVRVPLQGGPGNGRCVTVPIPRPECYYFPVRRNAPLWPESEEGPERRLLPQNLIAVYVRVPGAYVYTNLC